MKSKLLRPLLLFVPAVMALVWLQGCAKSYTAGLQSTTEKRDSTVIVERLRIDTIIVPGDTITVEIPLECDSNYRVKPFVIKQQSKRSGVVAEVRANMLFAQFDCRELAQRVYLKDSIINRLQSDKKHEVITRVEVRKCIPKWAWYTLAFSCAVVAFYIGKYGMKLYLKIQSGGLF